MIQQLILTSLIIAFPLTATGDMNYTPLPQTVEQKIEIAFGKDADLMKKIAQAESNLNSNAYNPEYHNGCQGSFGLFQIACVNYKGDPKDLYDPDINIKIAKQVLDSQGKKAWGVCRKIVDCS